METALLLLHGLALGSAGGFYGDAMAEELGTKDVLGQVDTRLTNVEQDLRAFRSDVREEFAAVRGEMRDGFAAQRGELSGFRVEVNGRIDKNTRWLTGLMFATWLTVMASIWLKP